MDFSEEQVASGVSQPWTRSSHFQMHSLLPACVFPLQLITVAARNTSLLYAFITPKRKRQNGQYNVDKIPSYPTRNHCISSPYSTTLVVFQPRIFPPRSIGHTEACAYRSLTPSEMPILCKVCITKSASLP